MITRRTLYLLVAALALVASLAGTSLRPASAATAASMVPTSITLTSDLNPAAPDTPLIFSGSITPTRARGWVVLYDEITGAPVEVGRVFVPRANHGMWALTVPAFSATSLGLGAHPLVAVYLGNARYQASMSAVQTEVIQGAHF
jgi:hypothetical protein